LTLMPASPPAAYTGRATAGTCSTGIGGWMLREPPLVARVVNGQCREEAADLDQQLAAGFRDPWQFYGWCSLWLDELGAGGCAVAVADGRPNDERRQQNIATNTASPIAGAHQEPNRRLSRSSNAMAATSSNPAPSSRAIDWLTLSG
jgi:hypothetical protein